MNNMRVIVMIVGLVTLTLQVRAGDWHTAGNLKCEDCHLQHSTDKQMDVIGPYSYLLKKSSVNELCLSCHDGSNPTAPDVFFPIQMYSSSSTQESSAGWFSVINAMSQTSHILGLPVVTPLQSSSTVQELNCASCHAVHGNSNFRNLLTDPAQTGASIRILDGVDIFTDRKPDDPPTAAGAEAAYARDNVGYVTENLSTWCTSCHDVLAINSQASQPAHFNGHPSNVAMDPAVSDPHVDAMHWVGGTGEGFPGPTEGLTRVPFIAPLAQTFTASRTPTTSSQVSCISCHKAHGSANRSALLWRYVEGGADFISGCQQCHNK